jgi:tRNA(Ile)-lysidine synthase
MHKGVLLASCVCAVFIVHCALTILSSVRTYARRHGLWHPRLRVLAAVSGGSDSVAMLFVLRELAAAGDLQLAGLAHVNHHVRPGASDEDEAFCRALASRLDVPVAIAHADVPALALAHRQSIEVAGRHARHSALADAATELGADRIATAHTRDDQAETMLLHLTRGAGLSGARGIEPSSATRIRPMLSCARADLRTWLTAIGEPWREDATNDDLANPRNRLRHEVLPALRQYFNPAVDAALARFADILREDDAHLTSAGSEAAARIVESRGDEVALDGAALAALPRALSRRVARIALATVHPRRSYDLEEVDAIVDAWTDPAGGRRDLPGLRMERSGRFVVLVHRETARPVAEAFSYPLPVPGHVSIVESGVVVEAEGPFDSQDARLAQGKPFDSHEGYVAQAFRPAAGEAFKPAGDPSLDPADDRVVVAADELGTELRVRSRRPGDRVRIPSVGHKKLQDLFVDRKVDRFARDLVPIVTDRSDRIVWVAGHLVAEEFRVGPRTDKVVILTLRSRKGAGRQR